MFVRGKSGQRHKYIVRAERHARNEAPSLYAVKFYLAQLRNAVDPYSYLTNAGRPLAVLSTAMHVMLDVARRDRGASFCWTGVARTDEQTGIADYAKTSARFRIYQSMAEEILGAEAFRHLMAPRINGYLLVSKASQEPTAYYLSLLRDTYPSLDEWALG